MRPLPSPGGTCGFRVGARHDTWPIQWAPKLTTLMLTFDPVSWDTHSVKNCEAVAV